ncbi:hypothetical protein NM208_g13402 [Fusarium decemcellulare]|uniref:Uncharacterized protein n=1 Tax=Fusarium decemcellulare TaxID=57161 RepID=A0ACC1RLW3_9HYPO|nr:hypothetical protein NM208_g13402 [Fusarium decemcellulare]
MGCATHFSATEEIFRIPELLEMILLYLDMKTLLVSASRVCRRWSETMTESPKIQHTACQAADYSVWFKISWDEPHPYYPTNFCEQQCKDLLLRTNVAVEFYERPDMASWECSPWRITTAKSIFQCEDHCPPQIDNLIKVEAIEFEPAELDLERSVFWVASKAFAAGKYPPPPKFPILLSQDGPVSTPEQLQEILETPSPPEPIRTATIFEDEEFDEPSREVSVCSLSFEEREKLEKRAHIQCGPAVWFQDKKRYCYWVVCLLQDGKEPHNTESN